MCNDNRDTIIRRIEELDTLFSSFAESHKVKTYRFYKDELTYSLFWWKRGMLRIIQLKVDEGGKGEDFAIWIGAYKLFLPILNFWTVYLEMPTDYSEKLLTVRYPFNNESVYRLLESAKQKIDKVPRKLMTKNAVALTVVKNIFLSENLLTVILFFGIIGAVFYIYLNFNGKIALR